MKTVSVTGVIAQALRVPITALVNNNLDPSFNYVKRNSSCRLHKKYGTHSRAPEAKT